jgi:hypothetical protein
MDKKNLYHYYGDSLRALFIIGGLIMLVSYPFFASFSNTPALFSIIGCVVLAVFGGLMNPKQKWIKVINMIIPIVAFMVFEHEAIQAILRLPFTEGVQVAYFWVNQILALIFFIAAYLATKTLRGAMISDIE